MVGFTGMVIDPVVPAYPLGHGYRWYLPGLQRFNATDGLSPFAAGGINSYAYCTGDPINCADPTGRFPEVGLLDALDLVSEHPPHYRALDAPLSIRRANSASLHDSTALDKAHVPTTDRHPTSTEPEGLGTSHQQPPSVRSLIEQAMARAQAHISARMLRISKTLGELESKVAQTRRMGWPELREQVAEIRIGISDLQRDRGSFFLNDTALPRSFKAIAPEQNHALLDRVRQFDIDVSDRLQRLIANQRILHEVVAPHAPFVNNDMRVRWRSRSESSEDEIA